MRQFLFIVMYLSLTNSALSQVDSTRIDAKIDIPNLLKDLSSNACKCIDSISTYDKSKADISTDIHSCIDKQVTVYQLGKQLTELKNLTEKDQKLTININVNPNSDDYKKYYYELERELMATCPAVKDKISSTDKIGEKSISNKEEALKFYDLGLEESKAGNFEKAITYYQKALVFDKEFAFAYDNIGICYRRLNDYDKAIEAYEKSLEIDPNGMMPLQNLGITYVYKKQYKKAVKAYERFAKVDPENPEAYYGLGNVYAVHLNEYEKALDHLCIAYNIYVKQKSPYRSDAEKLIQFVYQEMKKEGKEKKFNEILEKNNIAPN
ncbi:MAG: tetratricopeptide repeat protein [Flavobacterium sp.]|nr:tetratricopeptide repeat protein [Flavobacterium sp.]